MCDEPELKVPMSLAAAIAAERTQMLALFTEDDLKGYNAHRIIRWLAASLIVAEENLQKEKGRLNHLRNQKDSVIALHEDTRRKILELLQDEE